jgi:hypothetical protein
MTPEQQRIAIAKECPFVEWNGDAPFWRDDRGSIIRFTPLTDLNAMHAAEKALTDETWPIYLSFLTKKNQKTLTQTWMPVAHATAAQRAKAFLLTFNL